jgi:CRP-like cAMP-binding protein/predicted GNAT family N-acyltransferase
MHDLTASAPTAPINLRLLQSICREVRFEPGDILRQKGQYYRDMYVMTDGCVAVDRENRRGVATRVVSDAGSPIGEISFLRGCPATATVTAQRTTCALVLDDPTLARLESEYPAVAAHLLRQLAKTAEERMSHNLTWESATPSYRRSHTVEIYLCRNKDMLESAKRLRYEVYCQELGRHSPYADHDRKIITDDMDDTGHVFIAVEGSETIGTLRGNAAAQGGLGVLEELYGMRASAHHPTATAICTKFIVKKSKRGGSAGMKLITAMVRYGIRNHIRECYIDCIPALMPYYKAIGFTMAGPKFFHRENGLSYPLKLDLVKHGKRLSNEAGLREYLNLIMKAHAIRWIDRIRRTLAASR